MLHCFELLRSFFAEQRESLASLSLSVSQLELSYKLQFTAEYSRTIVAETFLIGTLSNTNKLWNDSLKNIILNVSIYLDYKVIQPFQLSQYL